VDEDARFSPLWGLQWGSEGVRTALAKRAAITQNGPSVVIRKRTARLIRRERQLGELFDALDAVGPGGSLLLLSGDAGVGKTRLLDELAARVDNETRVVRGGCVEEIAYAPWTDALWWLLGADGVAPDDLPKNVRSHLARLLPQLDIGEETPADGQHMLFEAIVDLLARASAGKRLALVIDDVHWIDPASGDLLRYVAQNLRRLPILLVLSYRPEYAEELRELFTLLARLGTQRLTLEPLDDDGAGEMAAQLLGRDIDEPEVQRIARASEGNPLFVEELAAAVDDDRVPESLRELLLGTVHRLGEDAQTLVRIAAVIGPRAPRALLAAVTGSDDASAQAMARAAIDARVFVAPDGARSYEFRHALVRQVVLDDLVPDERVALHRRIAAAITEQPSAAVDLDRVAELARHCDAAEDATEALRWSVAAGDQAVRRYAFEAGAAAYERALAWWPTVPDAAEVAGLDHVSLLLASADAAGYAGHVAGAADLARAALDEASATDPERCVEAVGRAYPLLWSADRAHELQRFTATALPVLDRVDAFARARFLENVVDEHLREFRPAAALEHAPRMLEAAAASGDTELEIRAHWLVAHAHELVGEVEEAIADFEHAVTLGRRTGSYSALALALYNEACAYASVPDFDAAERCLDEVDTLVDQYSLRRYVVPGRCERSFVQALRGDLADAAKLLDEVDDQCAVGLEGWFIAIDRALVNLHLGDYAATIAALDPHMISLDDVQDAERIAELALLRVEALAWMGDHVTARAEADRGLAALRGTCETYWHGWLAMGAMRVEADAAVAATKQRALDQIEIAQARAETIRETWATSRAQLRIEYPWARAFTLGCEAELARLFGADGAGAARSAADGFDDIGVPYYATYFRFRAAEATFAAGDQWEATQVLADARAAAHAHGFAGLEQAASATARLHQVRLGPGRKTVDGDEPLSEREREVLALLVEGRTNPEIGEALFISPRTARAHVSNLLRKLGVSSRVEAVADAHRRGLV
jgi:DNA-binding CsgD family transcriptional regulator